MQSRTFVIPGEPVPAPRMTRRDKWAKRPCVVKYFAWRDLARLSAGKLPPVEKIERLSWEAHFSLPKRPTVAQCLGGLHRSKPDRDNIDKALLDALFDQDQAIAQGCMKKQWGRYPCLIVTIEWSE